MKLYMGGPISGLTLEAASRWRNAWGSRFSQHGVTVIDPLRGTRAPSGVLLSDNFDDGPVNVRRDLWDITRSDVILCNFEGAPKVSIGTVSELAYAHALGKHCVVVQDEVGHHDHVFIETMASVSFHSMCQAFNWITTLS